MYTDKTEILNAQFKSVFNQQFLGKNILQLNK